MNEPKKDETQKNEWPKAAHPMLAAVAEDVGVKKMLTQGLLEPVETPRFRIFRNGVEEQPGETKHLLIECFYLTRPKGADGQPGEPVKNHIGVMEYGQPPNPDGLPNPPDTCRLTGPGGVVSALFSIVNGQLLIGLIEERRTLEFDPIAHPKATVLGTPRGYLAKPGAGAVDAARTELAEEVGKNLPTLEPHMAAGEPINPDNAWHDYTRKSDGTQGGGAEVCLFEVEQHLLVPSEDEGSYKLNASYPREKGSPWEKIGRCQFDPWHLVVQKRDGMNLFAFARVMSELFALGRAQLTFTPPATPA